MIRKVIFLDIDGVLQPGWLQNRFKHDLEVLKKELSCKYGAEYQKLDIFDLGAVYYDWSKNAVNFLRKLCDGTGAKIVISSSWRRSRTLPDLKKLFHIHGLDQYIVDTTPDLGAEGRGAEIEFYLCEHPEIECFVILDDEDVSCNRDKLKDSMVLCPGELREEQFRRAKIILEHTDKNSPLKAPFLE